MPAKTRNAWPFAAAFGFATMVAVPAYAADLTDYEEPPAPAQPIETAPVASWAGPYVGLQAGYGFSGETETPGGDIDTNGFVGGGFAGYNLQSGSFVYGVEGDIGYNGMDGSNATTRSESSVDGSLRARFGFAPNDTLMVYGTAGGAASSLEVTDTFGSDTNTMLGWTAGAGVEAALTENVFGRVEYRYTDYGSKTFNTGSGLQSVDNSGNKIQLGVGMKF